MRKIHIYCDGGFGNRFNGLVSGLAVAEAAGLEPLVVWPTNNWCGARFDEIFDSAVAVLDRELAAYAPERERFQWIMTEDHLRLGVPYTSPLALETIDQVKAVVADSTLDIYWHTPLIPAYIGLDTIRRLLQTLPIAQAINEQAETFMLRTGLSNPEASGFYGIQIRKTDFGARGADEDNLYGIIERAPHKRFFVCSDDKAVEQRFKALPNVIIFPKRAHVEKRVDGDWNALTADHSGRVYACNVNRSAQSVIDAVVDLLVLSRSQVVKTSNSTFLNTALLLKACR